MLCLALIVLLAAGAQVGVSHPTGSAKDARNQEPEVRLMGMGMGMGGMGYGYPQQMYQQPMMYQQPYMMQQYPMGMGMMQQPYMQGGYGMGMMPC